MTLPTETSRQDFIVSGTGPISFPHRLDKPEELELWTRTDDGFKDVKASYNVHYFVTVAGDFQSASVVLDSGFAATADGKTCSLLRTLPLTQELDVSQVQRFSDAAIEKGLDRSVMRHQQLLERVGQLQAAFEAAGLPDVDGVDFDLIAELLEATGAFRPRLTEDLNLYVATDGDDDANDGRTPATPYATWQRAIDEVIGNIDVAVFHPIINIADGTYDITSIGDGALIVDEMAPFFTIRGNLANPRNVLLRTEAENSLYQQYGGEVVIEGFKMEAPNDNIIKHDNGHLIIGNFDIGAEEPPIVLGAAGSTDPQIRCKKNAFLDIYGLEVDAGGACCLRADRGGTIRVQGDVARNNTPTYSQGFVNVEGSGTLLWYAGSPSGAISGPSHVIQAGGTIKTFQPGNFPDVPFTEYPDFFGGSEGSLGGGGQFDGFGPTRWSGSFDISDDDLDDITIPGVYIGDGLTNAPDGGSGFWTVRVMAGQFVQAFVEQIATKAEGPPYELWMRRRQNSAWQAWERLGAAYSEGSWTPAFTFDGSSAGVTYGHRVGRYIRHGNLVTVWGNVALTNNGSGVGVAVLEGLPFPTSDITDLKFTGSCQMISATGVLDGPSIEALPGTSSFALFAQDEGDRFILNDGNIGNTAEVSFQLTYRTG